MSDELISKENESSNEITSETELSEIQHELETIQSLITDSLKQLDNLDYVLSSEYQSIAALPVNIMSLQPRQRTAFIAFMHRFSIGELTLELFMFHLRQYVYEERCVNSAYEIQLNPFLRSLFNFHESQITAKYTEIVSRIADYI